jgi:hypothetical protein
MLYQLSYASPIALPFRSPDRRTKAASRQGHEIKDYHMARLPAMKPRPDRNVHLHAKIAACLAPNNGGMISLPARSARLLGAHNRDPEIASN